MKYLSCPICGSKVNKVIAEKSSYKLMQCQFCKHGFIDPMPTETQIKNEYLSRNAEDYFTFLDKTAREYGYETSRYIISHLKRFSCKSKLLDFGCGSGILIRNAIKEGYNAYGVDIGLWSNIAAEKYNLKIFVGDIQNSSFKKESFDIITMIDVLEHLNDPVKKTNECVTLLKKGGILVAQVPNISSIHAKLLAGRWGLFDPPSHIHYFSKKSLKLLFRKNNIELLNIQTRFVSGFGILGMKWINFILKPSLNFIKQGDMALAFGCKD